VLRDAGGALAGACSVHVADMVVLGGQRVWLYRNLLPGDAAVHQPAMLDAAYRALDADFDAAPGAPIGLCALLDADDRLRRPEALWTDPPMIYAGYLDDGRQIRVGWFTDAILDLEAMA
jgi:hypothetical protein